MNLLDEMPEELRKLIRDRLESPHDMAKASLVSKEWSKFFQPKLESAKTFHFFLQDPSFSQQVPFQQLKSAIEAHINSGNRSDVFCNLKKLEFATDETSRQIQTGIEFLEMIGLGGDQDAQVQENYKKINEYLSNIRVYINEKFGVIGLLQKESLLEAFNPTDTSIRRGQFDSKQMHAIAPLVALQMLLQQDDKHKNDLELINSLIKNKIVTVAGDSVDSNSVKFEYKNNQLCLVITEADSSNSVPLDDFLAMYELEPHVDNEAKILLENISSQPSASPKV